MRFCFGQFLGKYGRNRACANADCLEKKEGACEKALGITPSPQTVLLRMLTMYGLMIRDHALHLYLFVMPDLYNKDSFLDFDENIEAEHQLLHDAFGTTGWNGNLYDVMKKLIEIRNTTRSK